MIVVAITILLSGLLSMGLAQPLMRRKIEMNEVYGVRIPAAFESEARWFELNEYGGRLLFYWGIFVALLGVAGLFFDNSQIVVYGIATTVLILGSLGGIMSAVYRYAARTRAG